MTVYLMLLVCSMMFYSLTATGWPAAVREGRALLCPLNQWAVTGDVLAQYGLGWAMRVGAKHGVLLSTSLSSLPIVTLLRSGGSGKGELGRVELTAGVQALWID
jgi:hypothetical protein